MLIFVAIACICLTQIIFSVILMVLDGKYDEYKNYLATYPLVQNENRFSRTLYIISLCYSSVRIIDITFNLGYFSELITIVLSLIFLLLDERYRDKSIKIFSNKQLNIWMMIFGIICFMMLVYVLII